MELSALSHSHDPGVERHPGGRRSRYVSLAMVVALTTVLGACSGARTSETAQRGPSLRIADAALASGAPEMALRVADLILAKQPRNAAALTMRGDALYAMGRYDMARGAYRASIAIDPKDAGPRVGLGRILARSNPSAAEDALLGALKLDPDNVVALNNLGVVRDLQGHNAKAREAYDRALALAPDSPDVEINLGTSLALSGQKADAVRLLRGVASNAGAARVWRKEILSGLTLAGDGAWAREQLRADRFQTPREPVAASTRTRLAAGVASPSVGPIGSGGHAIRQTERFRPVDSGMMPNSPANGMLDNPISDAAVGTIPAGIQVPASPPVGKVALDSPKVAITPVEVASNGVASPEFDFVRAEAAGRHGRIPRGLLRAEGQHTGRGRATDGGAIWPFVRHRTERPNRSLRSTGRIALGNGRDDRMASAAQVRFGGSRRA